MIQLITCVLCLAFSASSITISDTIPKEDYFKHETQNIASYNTGEIINIRFEVTNPDNMTSAFIVTSFIQHLDDDNIKQDHYYGQKPYNYRLVDLDAMWSFETQYINLEKESGKDILYMTVFNYDSEQIRRDINYQITIQNSTGYECAPCQYAGDYETSDSCFCEDCIQGMGKRCSRLIKQFQDSFTATLNAKSITYFEIPADAYTYVQMNLAIDSGYAEAYLQYATFFDEVAAFHNVATSDRGQPAIFSLYGTSQSGTGIKANMNNKPLNIAIANFNDHSVQFNLLITSSGNVSVLVIVLAVLGSILLIVLIVAAVWIARRSQHTRVNAESEAFVADANKLSGDQIERYFPQAYLRQVVSGGSQAQMTMEKMQNKLPEDLDCVICLQKLEMESVIRMGYCKHMFHSGCLINWFKKQRNCPYCRKEFNRENTAEDYEKLMSENGKRVLRNLDLLKAIYNSSGSPAQ